MNISSGLSSLLFIITAIKSIYISKLIIWKLSNIFLVFSSFFYNINFHNNGIYLFLDYLTISIISMSHINNFIINSILTIIHIYEFIQTNNIVNIKNITFIISILHVIYNTYIFMSIEYVYILITSILIYLISYKIRLELYYQNNFDYIIALTWVGHICIMQILYIASNTI